MKKQRQDVFHDRANQKAQGAVHRTLKSVYAVLTSMPIGILLVTEEGQVEFANQAFCDIFNLNQSLADLKNVKSGETIAKIRAAYLNPEKELARLKEIVSSGKPVKDEEISMVGGKTVLRDFIPISLGANKNDQLWIHRDITRRKKIDEDLKRSERQFQETEVLGRIGSWEYDLATKKMIWSAETYVLFERDPKLGPPFLEEQAQYYLPDQAELLRDNALKTIETEKIRSFEFEVILPSRKRACYQMVIKPVKNAEGRIFKLSGTIQDVTQRKEAEEALGKEKDKAQNYLDIAGVILLVLDARGQVTLINRKGCQLLGYKREEIIGKNWFDNFVPVRLKSELLTISQRLTAGGTESFEFHENPILTRSGEERMISWHNTVLTDETGHTVGLLSSGEDVTESKKVEDMVRANEEKFRKLFELESDAIFLVDKETSLILEANPTATALYGYTREELLQMRYFNLSAELEQTKRTVELGIVVVPNRLHRRKDGTIFPVEISASFFDWQGRPVHMTAVRDITERKQSEDTLRRSEEKYRSLVNNVKLGIFRSLPGEEGRLWEVNEAMEEITGYSRVQLLTMEERKLYVNPDDRNKFLAELATSRGRVTRELDFKKKDGSKIVVAATVSAVRDSDNNILYFDGILEDITERKKAEDELRSNKKMISMAAQLANLGPWEYDLKDNRFVFNDEFYAIYGTNVEREGATMTPEQYAREFIHLDEPYFESTNYDTMRKFLELDGVQQTEHRIIRRDGKVRNIAVMSRIIKDNTGQVTDWYGANQDITERKQAEEALKASEEKYRSLVNNVKLGIFRSDPGAGGKFIEVNPAMEEITGYSRQELLQMEARDLYNDPKERLRFIDKVVHSRNKVTQELRFRMKDGAQISVFVTDFAIRDDSDNVTRTLTRTAGFPTGIRTARFACSLSRHPPSAR